MATSKTIGIAAPWANTGTRNPGDKERSMMIEDPSPHTARTENVHVESLQRDWRRAHEGLTRLAKCRAQLDWEEGRALLDALRTGAHRHLGFGSFGEYI